MHYTNQPRGCSDVTTLGYGRLVRVNFARDEWVARVYFTADILQPARP